MLELHLWCSQASTLEQPDRMVFDFDPDEGLDFARVRDAARDMRDRLKDLGWKAFRWRPAARASTWWCRSRPSTLGTSTGISPRRWRA